MQTGSEEEGVLVADLVAVVTGVVGVLAMVVSPAAPVRPLAILLGLPFVLLVPGYAIVAAVFPRAGDAGFGDATRTAWLARLGLSVVGSVVAIAIVGGVLAVSGLPFGRRTVLGSLCLLTLAATGIAWYRRRHLPIGTQAGVSRRQLWRRTRNVTGNSVLGVALTVVMLVAAAGAVGVVASDSVDSGGVTELYVLGADESGQLVAGNYPSTLTAGEPVTLGVGVGTTLETGFDGRVVTTLERITVTDGRTVITESERLGTFEVSLAAGERSVRLHTVEPTLVGERLRLTQRLYERGSDSPLRRVQIWVSVRPA